MTKGITVMNPFLTDLIRMLPLDITKRLPHLWCWIPPSPRFLDVHECNPEKSNLICCVEVHRRFWEEMRKKYSNFEDLAEKYGSDPKSCLCPMFETSSDLLGWLTELTGLPFVLGL